MEGTGSNLRLPMNPPFFFESSATYDKSTGAGTITAGFAGLIPGDKPSGNVRIWSRDIRPQFTQQWNFSLEFQLTPTAAVTAGYVAHKATHLINPRDFNQALPGTGPVSTWLPTQQRRPLYTYQPLITAVGGTESSATSDYNSLQVNGRKRYSRGLEFLLSYTLSKSITDNAGYYLSPGFVAAMSSWWLNSYNRKAERGLAFFDARHNFVWSGTYDLLGHPIRGASWEGMIIENILGKLPEWRGYFYRSATGAELDLVLEKGRRRIAIECKLSSAPEVRPGFWNALADVGADEAWIIAPVRESYPIRKSVTVAPLPEFLRLHQPKPRGSPRPHMRQSLLRGRDA